MFKKFMDSKSFINSAQYLIMFFTICISLFFSCNSYSKYKKRENSYLVKLIKEWRSDLHPDAQDNVLSAIEYGISYQYLLNRVHNYKVNNQGSAISLEDMASSHYMVFKYFNIPPVAWIGKYFEIVPKHEKNIAKFYIIVGKGLFAVDVPSYIIDSKDCILYKEFAVNIAKTGFVPSIDCPWSDVGDIALFKLNNTKFLLDRKYIWFGNESADGESSGLYIMFRYPKFEPASLNEDQSMNIMVTIKPQIRKSIIYNNKIHVTPAQSLYLSQAVSDKSLHKIINSLDINQYIGDSPVQGMKSFIYNGKVKAYFSGELLTPNEWIYCNPDIDQNVSPGCYSAFMYDGNNIVEFYFSRRELLKHYWEIRRKIKEKLDEFHENGKKAP